MAASIMSAFKSGASFLAVLSLIVSSFAPLTADAAGFSYAVSIVNADFTNSTLTVTASVDVTKFVGTATSQWVKVTWGDGNTDLLQANAQLNYATSNAGKDFAIHNLVVSHTYVGTGSFSVTLKVFHGNEQGNEGSANESNTVTFQTENTLLLCTDGTDNDHDGLIDLADPDCAAFINHAPVANDDTYNTPEDTQLSVSLPGVISNDTDNEADPLTAALVSDVSHGTLTLNTDGSFDYTPDTNWTGVDSFTYKVNDGNQDSNTATVSINVSSQNDAPVAVADEYTVAEDATLTVNTANGVLTNDTDTENDPLTAQVESSVNDGVLSFNTDGSFTYSPDANWNGMESFTYKASDGNLLSGTQTVVIHVTPVNDAPIANANAITTAQNTPVSNTLTGSDIDSSTLTFATSSNPVHGTLVLDGATGAFTYTPSDPTYVGADSFDFTVSDGALTSASSTILIVITATVENTQTLCSDGIDNDFDGQTDLNDTDCAAFIPVVTPPQNGGGNGGGGNGGGGGGGGVISGPLSVGYINGSGSNGLVLGASTDLPAGCSAYLNAFLKLGGNNDKAEVIKLQTFLNAHLGTNIPVTGYFGLQTFAAVKQFQLANWEQVLKPWVSHGLSGDHTPTGYVYKTTKRMINLVQCSTLDIPMPILP